MQDIGKNVAVKLNIGYMVRQIATLFPAVMTEFHRLYPQSVVYAIDGHLSAHVFAYILHAVFKLEAFHGDFTR